MKFNMKLGTNSTHLLLNKVHVGISKMAEKTLKLMQIYELNLNYLTIPLYHHDHFSSPLQSVKHWWKVQNVWYQLHFKMLVDI